MVAVKKQSSRIPIIDPSTGEEVNILGEPINKGAAAASPTSSATTSHTTPVATGLTGNYKNAFVPSKQGLCHFFSFSVEYSFTT